jgi:hypothetical protein
MTEAEWLACDDPKPMLEFLQGKASDRKLRLLAVAFCRIAGELFAADRALPALLSFVERLAEGEVVAALAPSVPCGEPNPSGELHPSLIHPNASVSAWNTASIVAFTDRQSNPLPLLAAVLRDSFGNPFRPRRFDPDWFVWNEGTIRRLAQGIHEDRAYDRLPILGDALEDAGCADADILSHLRSPGPHVRGCWPLDLILGKQ